MQDKFFDTDDQQVEDLFADITEEDGKGTHVPAIKIVHFDEQDRPATSETRLLSSFQ